MAMVEAAKILRKHLNPFVQYFELGEQIPQENQDVQEDNQEKDLQRQKLLEKLELSVETLELSVRASNCLNSAGIRLIKELVQHTEADLLKIRNLGKNSLNEIKENLKKIDLTLGMVVETNVTSEEESSIGKYNET
jgi:DNA-directed RNA polymerase subunit alpha